MVMKHHRMPNLYLSGVEKAGTSFLYDLIAQHSQIFAPKVKEPRVFLEGIWNDKGDMSWGEYEELYRAVEGERYILDGSPLYFYYEEAMRRISEEANGEATMIVVLRDPISRAYSHYQMMLTLGSVPRLSFSELFSRSTNEDHEEFESTAPYRHLFSRSLYHKSLEAAYSIFSQEQVLCLVFEELKQDWVTGCRQIFEFLGLENESVDLNSSRRNTGYGVKGSVGRSLVSMALKCGRPLKQIIPVGVYDRMKTSVMRSGELLSKLEPTPELDDWELLEEMKSYYADDVDNLAEILGGRPAWLLQEEVTMNGL
tara:strand:- start:1329 stop:2264 length:936 start_codon:yes stop_codon:yes gene_type:complete